MNDLPPLFSELSRKALIALIAESHRRMVGSDLVTGGDPVAALWEAPQIVVAHDTQVDPHFFFGNRAALDLFECTDEQFCAMPSRLSAEAPLRSERQRLMERVAREGYVDDYAGIRISRTGKRFNIERATVWNLLDEEGAIRGQAAAFDDWSPIDETA